MHSSLDPHNEPRKRDDDAPPGDDGFGIILARFRRGEDAELRVTLRLFQGRKRAVVCPFQRQSTGEWRPIARGIALDAGEMRGVRDALSRALLLMSGMRR
jgi:hypothetical protein